MGVTPRVVFLFINVDFMFGKLVEQLRSGRSRGRAHPEGRQAGYAGPYDGNAHGEGIDQLVGVEMSRKEGSVETSINDDLHAFIHV